MVLMPMSGFVDNTTAEPEFVETNPSEDDFFNLPDRIEEQDYDFDPATELQGLRGETTKTFVNDDGTFTQMVTSEPIHYLTQDSVWTDINLNIQPTLEGWEVTENTFETQFAPEAAGGIAVQANQWVDPVLSGINPGVIGLGEIHDVPELLDVAPAHSGVEVGGNTIRYPLAEGIELDYTVTTAGVKQNMILREQPIIPEHINHFGLSEQLMLPSDYVLYAGEQQVGEEFVQTQDGLQIRHVETGDLLAEIPAPVVLEADSDEPYLATFVARAYGPTVLLITVVDADWLLDDDRAYPISIDPTLNVGSASGGDCYIRYGSCSTSTSSDHYKYYGTYYYAPWHKFTFTSANSMLPGATVEKIEWQKSVTYASWQNTGVVDVKVLEECGLDATGNYGVSANNCTGAPIAASKLAYAGSYSTNGRSLVSSIGNSPTFATVSAQYTGTKTAVMCNTAASCNSTTGAVGHVTSALANLGTIGIGEFVPTNNYTNYDTSGSGSNNNKLLITYSGGIDTVAPTADFVPYTGIDFYIEGVRTLFIELSDNAFGIDTTASGGPTLHYSTDGGTTWSSMTYGLGSNNQFDAGEVVSIGTCGASDKTSKFKARTPDLTVGDDFKYYWEFQDMAPSTQTPPGPNTGYEPALTGTQTTPTPYGFEIVDWETAPWEHKKMVTLATDVHASSYYTPQGFLDRQMTYYTHSDEYFFEFDTSGCGTGSQQCWYTGTSTFYGNWIARWNNNPPSGSYGMNSGSTSGNQYLRSGEGGYLQIDAQHGPGMNLIYYYDSNTNSWGVVGVDTETGIDTPLIGGSSMDPSVSYGYASASKFSIPSNFTGTHGHFDFNSTGSYTNVIYTDTLDTVTGVSVTNGGSGHSSANNIATTTSGSGSGLTVDVTASTGVTGLSVTSQGTNFSDATNVSTTTSGSGTGLTVDVTVTSTTVNNTTTSTTSFTVNSAGSGYAVGDTVTVSSGVANATDATLSVASIDGIVTSVAVNDAGSGYAVGDTVTLTSSGVAATLSVSSITDVRTYANTTTDLADRVCVTSNGWTYFYKSGTYDRCTPAYYMIYGSTSSYRWSGFALGSGYYGRQAATGTMTYKVGYVAPLPDIYEPEVEHTALGDSHASTRVVSVMLKDAGDPASGLNTTQTPGVGPTMYYRIGGSSGTWTSSLMDAQGVSDPDDCQLAECVWTADIEDIEVNDTVEYYFTV